MKWEYQTIKLAATGFMGGKVNESQLDQKMNELGAEGWELAAAFDTDVAGGAHGMWSSSLNAHEIENSHFTEF